MEQFVTALYESADPSVRSWFGEVDEIQLVEMAAAGSGYDDSDERGGQAARPHCPRLLRGTSSRRPGRSRELGGADRPLTVGHLLAGALLIGCRFIEALRERESPITPLHPRCPARQPIDQR